MRYITVPNPVTLPGPRGEPQEFGLDTLFEQNAVPHEYWRSGSRDAVDIFEAVCEKFGGIEPGAVIELEDKEYEAISPLLTMKDEKLRPDVAKELFGIMKSVILASKKDPREQEAAKAKKPVPSKKPAAESDAAEDDEG